MLSTKRWKSCSETAWGRVSGSLSLSSARWTRCGSCLEDTVSTPRYGLQSQIANSVRSDGAAPRAPNCCGVSFHGRWCLFGDGLAVEKLLHLCNKFEQLVHQVIH